MEQYKTPEERDKVLEKEIRFYEHQVLDIREQITGIEASLVEEEKEEGQLHQRIMVHFMLGNNFLHCDALREEKNARANMDAVKVDVQHAEQDIRRLVPKSIMNGVDSVRHVLDYFRSQNANGQHNAVLEGYRGIVIELFRCEQAFMQAVEVTVGNRLFYHVVDDDRVAMKIMKEINQQKLMGEINFFPINRVVAKPRRELGTEVMFSNFIRLLCVNCCDQISRRGEMTGGFLDMKRSRLELYNAVQRMRQQLAELEAVVEKASCVSNEKAANVEKLRLECDVLDREILTLKDKHRTASEKKRFLSQQLQQSMKNREPKIAQCVYLKNRIREVEATAESLNKQLGTPLMSQLSEEEKQMLNQLQENIGEKKLRLDSVNRSRVELESTKLRLENQLTTNLHRKRENLQSKIHDISVDEKRNHLQTEMAELESVNRRLSEIISRLSELELHLAEYDADNEKLTRELEECQEQQRGLEAQVADFSKQVDLICTKQSAMQAKREEINKKVRFPVLFLISI
ncbi:unnamed protein product [Gongylonema pulchrum]|uniref:SMC hinge domain-containing protein n=1 Tax=Gongylonema pulchrum TaxID=637853 RepID=A0A183DW65_9BILA|nr:unnamed protein product [Gongylonema pulchrum]